MLHYDYFLNKKYLLYLVKYLILEYNDVKIDVS